MGRLGRFFSSTAATLTVAGIAHGAFAADLAVPASAPAPRTINWTGLYAGGSISAAFNSARFTQPLSGLDDTSIGTIDSQPAFSVYGGANYQVLPWAVLGVEANYTWLNATYRNLGPALDFLDKTNHIDSVDGRIGVLLRPDTMIYGKAGWAQIEVQGFQNFGNTFHEVLPAVQIGGGIESLVTQNIAVRADVSYTYADRLLSLNSNTDLYRPGFLMFGLGAEYKFDVPGGFGVPATFTADTSAPNPKSRMVYKSPPPPPPAVGPNWTGFEVGGFFSANGNKSRYSDTLLPGELGPFTQFDIGGGWFVGANYQYQRFVFGIEGSANYEAANFNTPAGSGGLVGNFFNFAKIDRVIDITGRAGWLMTPDTLLYFKGGPASIRMTPNAQYWNSIAPNPQVNAHNFGGYIVGFGAETYVMPHVSVRLEGLYTHTGQRVVLQGTVPNEFTLQPSILTATLGAAYHF